jgi:hypothetical protein
VLAVWAGSFRRVFGGFLRSNAISFAAGTFARAISAAAVTKNLSGGISWLTFLRAEKDDAVEAMLG